MGWGVEEKVAGEDDGRHPADEEWAVFALSGASGSDRRASDLVGGENGGRGAGEYGEGRFAPRGIRSWVLNFFFDRPVGGRNFGEVEGTSYFGGKRSYFR